jgi:hypothetical protein
MANKRELPAAIPVMGPTNESKPSLRTVSFSLPLAFESKLSTPVLANKKDQQLNFQLT